jgi:hypothetical protein
MVHKSMFDQSGANFFYINNESIQKWHLQKKNKKKKSHMNNFARRLWSSPHQPRLLAETLDHIRATIFGS